jgi:hypothetical protein
MNRPADTSIDAEDRQFEALRAMTPAARLRLADAMSSEVGFLARAGVRARHPEYSSEEIETALLGIMLGESLSSAVRSRRPVGAR